MAQPPARLKARRQRGDVRGPLERDGEFSSEKIEQASPAPRTKDNTTPSLVEDTTPYGTADLDTPLSSSDTPKRQKRPSRKQTSSQFGKGERPKSASTQTSLISDIVSDALGLLRAAYPYMKWPIFLYILWLLFSHLTAAAYVHITEKFEPICSIPWLGQKLPLCPHHFAASTKRVNATKMSTSQQQLEGVIKSAGKGLGLSMDMLSNEYAVRDLTVRVKHSELRRKDDLGKELDSLIALTTRTSDGLSDFTSRVGSVTDSVVAFDRFAVRNLQAIIDRQKSSPSLPQILVSSLSPFSAFEPRYKTELELKEVFVQTTSQMASRLLPLIEEAGHLRYLLRRITDTLDVIKGLTLEEIKDSPEMAVLAELWVKVARHDDYVEYKSHQTLLTDITAYYATAAEVIKETLHALNKMRSDLNEFRDIHATPALVWRDIPLEVTLEMMSESMRRLESGRRRIDGDERVDEVLPPSSTRYVTANHRRDA